MSPTSTAYSCHSAEKRKNSQKHLTSNQSIYLSPEDTSAADLPHTPFHGLIAFSLLILAVESDDTDNKTLPQKNKGNIYLLVQTKIYEEWEFNPNLSVAREWQLRPYI
jgi:hypothetical protein